MAPVIEIRLSGPLAVVVDGATADLSPLGRLGALTLGYLAAEHRRPVSREELADIVWDGSPPATWPHALRNAVNRVRRALDGAGLAGPRVLTAASGCYRLCLPAEAVIDVERAAASVKEAHEALAADGAGALEAAGEAVALSAGQFLAGLGGDWVEGRQSALVELHLSALEALAEARRLTGDAAGAVDAAAEAVRRQPFRESAHLRLIEAHAAAGNRAEALRAYERCRRALAEELGVSPSPTTEATYRQLMRDVPRLGRRPHPITSFVGRASEVARVRALISASRLVSVVGIGGIGKSRIALEAAGQVDAEFPGGIWVVELAGLGDPELVPAEVLAVLEGPPPVAGVPIDAVVGHLGGAGALIVLDNCEHLVEACADLAATVLSRCPNVCILTTTREPLRVAGETTWLVPPLTVAEAVQLFVERSGVAADEAGVDDVASRLDGIPLAIELAAGWTTMLSVAEIAERLVDRFALLTSTSRTAPARQRTLLSTLDWSYSALSEVEAEILRGLSVFVGGFTLPAATAVAAVAAVAAPELLRALSGLVDKALILVDHSRRPLRYRQLETVREYAAARLSESGVNDDWRRRHLHWALALAESDLDQDRWVASLDAELDNLRVALDWAAAAAEGVAELGARLAAALGRFWEIRGYWGDGRQRLGTWLARADVADAPRAQLLNAAANLAQHQRDYAAARAFHDEALSIRLRLHDELGAATARHGLANLAFLQNDLATARAGFEENLALARRREVGEMAAVSLLNLGVIEQLLVMRGTLPADIGGPQARRLLLDALAASEHLGDQLRMALALENLGTLAAQLGDDEEARSRLEASLAIRRRLGDRAGIAVSMRALTRVSLRGGDAARARALSEEYLEIEQDLGRPHEVAEALAVRAEVATHERDYRVAEDLLDRSIALERGQGAGRVPDWISAARAELARLQRASR